jgi:solute carrier family 25 (adenine nucleotide translocator) protein 4/5/6/31
MSAFASTSDKGEFIAILRGFSAGGAAAVLSKSMTAPLDRVKLLLQLQNRGTVASTSSAHYTGVVDCFKRVCLEQGVRSLWRGNSATVLRSFPTHALNFVMRDYYRLMFLKNVDRKVNYGKFVMGKSYHARVLIHPILGNILAGACGGMTSLCLVYPLDLARTRLAVETKHRGIYDCLRSITQKEGFAGMYRGFFVSLQFVALSRAAFFGMFDTIRGTIAEDTKQLHFFTVWFIAQVQ